MAVNTVSITTSWQRVGAGIGVFTVTRRGTGQLLFNRTASDTNAYVFAAEISEQFRQTEQVDTYVRATSSGWEVLADGVLP